MAGLVGDTTYLDPIAIRGTGAPVDPAALGPDAALQIPNPFPVRGFGKKDGPVLAVDPARPSLRFPLLVSPKGGIVLILFTAILPLLGIETPVSPWPIRLAELLGNLDQRWC
ncbi:hypothetical protein CBS133816_1757 [Aspergillus niger]|nr:hypothetical protein CBS133816_1757 [Aspergillus niger]